ncbi:hypothetical protein AAF712_013582 [Marasmius tenuissimus]|uniref:Uncharacterized protein n=1 Tax=Marasmius tenuissimus TaxID=585030 RepID=A0ABR2ZFA9_9AGAR|nr:hypothetical protein PM082_015039 [Marasmius tenuissimus]
MAPKPVPRTDSALTKAELDAKAMPPPPVPVPQMTILEPEMNALSGCLKNAAVKSGQILRFYSDTQKLNIRKHVSAPPLSLQASLGRELELYDQICESIESHLLRAISILQRDLQVEEEQKRIKEAELAAMASPPKQENISPTTTPGPLSMPATGELATETQQSMESSSNASQSPSVSVGRRPSAISISSLHRPSLPPKLDLSSTSLRIGEEAFLSGGLHSPITLAPRSARPTDYTDLLFGPTADNVTNSVDMDLTLPDSDASENINMDLDRSIGNSADKPIELDMDTAMKDLFGDPQKTPNSTDNVEGLYGEGQAGSMTKVEVEPNFLDSLASTGEDIFSSLPSSAGQTTERNAENLTIPSTNAEAAPSPGNLIASLSETPDQSSGENANGSQSFDDFGSLFGPDNPLDNLTGNYWNMGGDQVQGISDAINSNIEPSNSESKS